MESLNEQEPISCDQLSHNVQLAENGTVRSVPLTSREFDLFMLFFRNREKIFSRNEIVEMIWGAPTRVALRSVDVYVCKLRSKLSRRINFIRAIPKVGYQFNIVTSKRKERDERRNLSLPVGVGTWKFDFRSGFQPKSATF